VRTIRQSEAFARWFGALRDKRAKDRIAQRIVRIQAGLMGDVKRVGAGVSELRVDYGPGYRITFCRREEDVILLLCGGDKSTQDRDIRDANPWPRRSSDEDVAL
jgi:putative addiction module killer protein